MPSRKLRGNMRRPGCEAAIGVLRRVPEGGTQAIEEPGPWHRRLDGARFLDAASFVAGADWENCWSKMAEQKRSSTWPR